MTNTTSLTPAVARHHFRQQPQRTAPIYEKHRPKSHLDGTVISAPIYHTTTNTEQKVVPIKSVREPPPPPPPRLDKQNMAVSPIMPAKVVYATPHKPPALSSPNQPTRKYFYEEACTAFNVPLPSKPDSAGSEHVQNNNAIHYNLPSVEDCISEGTPSNFSVGSFETTSLNESVAPVVVDHRLREFAENELQLLDEQIAVLFQGSDVGLGRRMSCSSYNC